MGRYVKMYDEGGALIGVAPFDGGGGGGDAQISSIDTTLPATGYSTIHVTMTNDVTLGDIVMHMLITASNNGSIVNLTITKHTSSELYASNNTNPFYAITVDGNIITISDVTSGHGFKINSIEWE